MTGAERVKRFRERQAERDKLMQEAVQFVRTLRPDEQVPAHTLALQQRLRTMLAEREAAR